MKNTIKERLASCPCLKDRKSAFLTGAAVAAGGLLMCRPQTASETPQYGLTFYFAISHFLSPFPWLERPGTETPCSAF